MRALICPDFGGIDSLKIADLPAPEPRKGEVVIDVITAGLNFFDTLIIENKYQTKPKPPFSPGAEFCGIITKLGEGVSKFSIGDRVAGYIPFGACREQLIVKSENLALVPEAVTHHRAAGLMVTYGTTLHALKDRGHLQPGEKLLVMGASGGTGLAAVELGKAMGATVIAAASSETKLAMCKEHGADYLINYSEGDLKEKIRDICPKGVDVVYDPVGDKYTEPAVRATAWGGRYLVIGFAAGDIPRIPLNLPLLKGMSLVGVFWGAFTEKNPKGHQENMAMLLDYVASGQIKVHIGKTYSLDDAAQAIADLKARKAIGKFIVDMKR